MIAVYSGPERGGYKNGHGLGDAVSSKTVPGLTLPVDEVLARQSANEARCALRVRLLFLLLTLDVTHDTGDEHLVVTSEAVAVGVVGGGALA